MNWNQIDSKLLKFGICEQPRHKAALWTKSCANAYFSYALESQYVLLIKVNRSVALSFSTAVSTHHYLLSGSSLLNSLWLCLCFFGFTRIWFVIYLSVLRRSYVSGVCLPFYRFCHLASLEQNWSLSKLWRAYLSQTASRTDTIASPENMTWTIASWHWSLSVSSSRFTHS